MFAARILPLVRCFAVLSLGTVCGCSLGGPDPVRDPAGTVSSGLRTQGQGNFLIDFDLGSVSSANAACLSDLYLDINVNFVVGCPPAGQAARRIADVGPVAGLGAITVAPTAGFVVSLSAIAGHGYVLEDNGRRWRIFVTSTIVGAGALGVIGVNITWTSL